LAVPLETGLIVKRFSVALLVSSIVIRLRFFFSISDTRITSCGYEFRNRDLLPKAPSLAGVFTYDR